MNNTEKETTFKPGQQKLSIEVLFYDGAAS